MKNKRLKNIIATITIVVFTILMIMPFLWVGQIAVHSDWSFHASRVQQIYLNLQKGQWFTYIATDTFSKVGNANFLFYPSIFLYPWALLKFVFAPVTAYLVYVWLLFLATGLIAFYCMKSFTNGNIRQSLFFAIIYLIAPYHLYLTLSNYVLGEAQAYTFIPLILLGMWNVLYRNKWIMLAVGMSLMAYSHYVSVFISVEVCFIMLICYFIQNQKVEWHKIINLIKAMVLFALLSAWQFIPLFTDYLHSDLMRPASGFMLMQSAGDFIVSAISNDALNRGGIGLVLLITLIFGWMFIEKNSKYTWVYIIGVIITLMITTAFPWQYFANTPLSIIQFPYRYTSYAIAFLAIVLSKTLLRLNYSTISTNVVTSVILLAFILLYAGSIYSDIARNKNTDNNVAILANSRQGKYKTLRDPSDTPIILTNASYNKQFSYGALYGETDYMPVASFKNWKSIFNRVTFINNKETKVLQRSGVNKLIYNINLKESSKVDLPALAYRHTIVHINGSKSVSPIRISQRGTVQLNLSKGKYYIVVSYLPIKLLCYTRIIALLLWITLIGIFSYHKFIRNN